MYAYRLPAPLWRLCAAMFCFGTGFGMVLGPLIDRLQGWLT